MYAFSDSLRIVTDLCAISLFPAAFVSHVSSHELSSRHGPVDAPALSKVLCENESRKDTDHAPERVLLPSLTQLRKRTGLEVLAYAGFALLSSLAYSSSSLYRN